MRVAVILLVACGLACSPRDEYRLANGADSLVAPLAQRVDGCLARANGEWSREARACMCPAGDTFRGAPLACHVGNQFVAFDGAGLPFLHADLGNGERRVGLAYMPAGAPPTQTDLREFTFGGFATLDDSARTGLGPRWYYVAFCRGCD